MNLAAVEQQLVLLVVYMEIEVDSPKSDCDVLKSQKLHRISK